MSKAIFSLILIALTGAAFIWSFNNLMHQTQINLSNQAQNYIEQNDAINDLLLNHPKPLTINDIKEYDKTHGTNLWPALEKSKTSTLFRYTMYTTSNQVEQPNKISEKNDLNELIGFVQSNNVTLINQIEHKQNGFLTHIPPMWAMLVGGISAFFITIITNIANSFYAWSTKTKKRQWHFSGIGFLLLLITIAINYLRT